MRGATALATLALALTLGCSEERAPAPPEPERPTAGISVRLYFPGPDRLLHAEQHRLDPALQPETRARRLLQLLLAGPTGEDLIAPLDGIERARVHLLEGGVAYVDLIPAEQSGPPQMGSADELLTVYSVVNTLALNVPEVKRVVLLWNGVQHVSFAGHVDTSAPLTPDPRLNAT